MFLKLPLNISIAVQNYAHFSEHLVHNPKENGGGDLGLGYLRKEEEDFFSAIPKKRRIKFGVRKC